MRPFKVSSGTNTRGYSAPLQRAMVDFGSDESFVKALTHEGSATHKCYSYLMRRLHQLHYDEAIKYDLPIGSGEIESAHRYIIQNRVKIQGAWWLLGNAESMISLSICRANNDWKCYWENCDAA